MSPPVPAIRPPMPASGPLDVDVDAVLRVLRPHGELDHATAPLLIDAAAMLTVVDRSDFRISLAGIRFLGAAGLNALVHIRKTHRADGVTVRIEDVPHGHRRLFEIGNAAWLLA